jgi:hypothetical protein
MRYFLLLFFLFFSVRSSALVSNDYKPSVLLYPEIYEVIQLQNTLGIQGFIAEKLSESENVFWKGLENEITLIKVHASHPGSKNQGENLELLLKPSPEFNIISGKCYGREYLPQAYVWCLNIK